MTLSADQLDSLVAPIALYPDPLLAQALAASTYPLEIIQLQQWLAKNPELKDKALADAVGKQPWDPAIQSLAAVPELTKRLSDDIQWTTDLGNAFLAQQSDVMDAVQRMRKKAQANGALTSNEQQKVETKVIETQQIIIVEPAKPEVVYVPVYSATVVYGPPVYPYPPVYYPPYTPGAALVTFGVGMMVGAAIGGTCCGCGWGHGHGNVNINVNNNYNRNTNINRNTNVNRAGNTNNNWQHNAEHRGGTPYADRNTATKYGGSARGDSRAGGPSASNRASTGRQPTSRPSANYSPSSSGFADRASGGGRNGASRGASAGNYDRGRGGGGDRIGSREIGGGNSSARGGGFGNSNGWSGSGARASSSRGASSFGGGRGGGGRGGGGRRR